MKKVALVVMILGSLSLVSCRRQTKETDASMAAEAPPPAAVERTSKYGVVKVDHPELFQLVKAQEFDTAPMLNVTGVVSPDVSRQVPVISLASGRVVDIRAKLGDTVKKGEYLMRVRSSDIAGAYSDYRKAVSSEKLARIQLERAKRLHNGGVIALNDFQVAQDAENKANVDVETTKERLKALGADSRNPGGLVNIYAPISGTITDQQVTLSSGIQAFSTPSPLTISDLSNVWIVCDVYENDLRFVHVGDTADVRLNAYPDHGLKGKIVKILPILDPNLHTAKVRLELANPGLMSVGMFVTATFRGANLEKHAVVPATAVMHLHDSDWVYVPLDKTRFRRLEVTGGRMLGDGRQEIIQGLRPGDQVVANALVLQNAVEP